MIDLSFPTVKLGNHIRKINLKVKDSEYEASNITVYGVTNSEGITVTGQKVSDDIGNYILLQENQFAYNPYRINVGSLGLFQGNDIGAVSPAYVVFEALDTYDSQFLLFYLKSPLGIKLIKWYGDRGGVRAALRYDDLCKIDVPEISINKQRLIMQKFSLVKQWISEYDHQIEKQDRYITKLRQSILQQAVEGKLCEQRPTDESVSELLKRIKAKAIASTTDSKKHDFINLELSKVHIRDNKIFIQAKWVCHFITKGTTPNKSELKNTGEIPFLKVYNIVNNKINFKYRPQYVSHHVHSDVLARSKVYPNDVLMNIVGPPLGKVAIVPNDYPEWNINQAIAIFRPLNFLSPEYIYIVLLEGSAINKIATVGTVGQDNISLAQCRDIIIPLPSLSEQKRIVAKVNKLMAYCDELENQVNECKTYAEKLVQSVLARAFNAESRKKFVAEVIAIDPQIQPQPIKLVARGNISEETMKYIEQTIDDMCGES